MNKAKILYFINDVAPTAEQFAEANGIPNAHVVFRNARFVPTEKHSLEKCDGVMGEAAPQLYVDEFPTLDEALEKYSDELERLQSTVGDSPAPGAQTPSRTSKAKEKKAEKEKNSNPAMSELNPGQSQTASSASVVSNWTPQA